MSQDIFPSISPGVTWSRSETIRKIADQTQQSTDIRYCIRMGSEQ